MRITLIALVALCAHLAVVGAPAAHADTFDYRLGNHPDGSANPPAYGLRLDGLFDGNQDTTVTFDFEYGTSAMYLRYDSTAGTVRIYGTVYGGVDTGSGYSGTPTYYEVDFLYTTNVSNVDGTFDGTGDDKLAVTGENSLNKGTIKRISDDETWDLVDEQGSHSYSFRFNNTDDHRLPTDLKNTGLFVGWGWLTHSGATGHLYDSDWLFTATAIPEPGTLALLCVGLAGSGFVARRRRTRLSA